MNCQETEKLLHGYVDGELDLKTSLEVEEHLEGCALCAQTRHSLRGLHAALGSMAHYYEPPAALRARIHALLPASAAGRSSPRHRFGWLAMAASVLLVAMSAWTLMHVWPTPATAPALAEELIASHVRSQMLPAHLVDVPSSDQHTVKPWLEGKLDFSPKVPDLIQQGFTLVGGRLDYLQRRPVAAVVYQRGKHLLTLFIWPTEAGAMPATDAVDRQGFHLLSWRSSGMTYWVVSDLNAKEMSEFVKLVQGK